MLKRENKSAEHLRYRTLQNKSSLILQKICKKIRRISSRKKTRTTKKCFFRSLKKCVKLLIFPFKPRNKAVYIPAIILKRLPESSRKPFFFREFHKKRKVNPKQRRKKKQIKISAHKNRTGADKQKCRINRISHVRINPVRNESVLLDFG